MQIYGKTDERVIHIVLVSGVTGVQKVQPFSQILFCSDCVELGYKSQYTIALLSIQQN